MSARPAIRDRYSFANLDEVLELPDLIAIQRESFEWFLKEGLAETLPGHQPDQGLHRDAAARARVDRDEVRLRQDDRAARCESASGGAGRALALSDSEG